MLKFIKKHYFIFILLGVALFLSFKNYTPGTFLSGWDTLHPEFDFGLNFKRVIFGVFRQEQGLGAVAGHSHMADLPRIIILYFLNFLFPMQALRYLYVFLMLIMGSLGMYFFLYRTIFKDSIFSGFSKVSAFLGALFYLLNLGTMQQFFVPFEMFTAQYGMLPWIFLFATEYLYTKKPKKVSVFLFLILLFSAPMAYAATLWYVFFLALTLYLLALSLPSLFQRKYVIIKRSFFILLLIFLANSFWILPNFYFIITHGQDIAQANINKLFSEQAFFYNKEFGNLKDVSLLKTFYFDWRIYSGNRLFTSLLDTWTLHLKNNFVETIGYFLALISLLGILYSVFKKSKGRAYLPLLIFCLFFLFNENGPTSFIYKFLEQQMPLFREGLRFPDDKVLGLFTFVFAIYFAIGQAFIFKLVSNLFGKGFGLIAKPTKIFYVLCFILILSYFMLPAFKGNLISQNMRIKIPTAYFEMFNWFNNQKDYGKVAYLPIHSFWGWEYYDWYKNEPSFQGAGFLWFGIKQPLMHRDFDRWSSYNEQYYREMSYAVYTQNPGLLENTIKKYKIGYIILDTSIIAPESSSKTLFYDEIKKLIQNSKIIEKPVVFGNNLLVYKVKDSFSSAYYLNNPSIVSGKNQTSYEDFVYQSYGDYISGANNKNSSTVFPFSGILDNQSRIPSGNVKITGEGAVFKLTEGMSGKTVAIPSYFNSEKSLQAVAIVEKSSNKIKVTLYPQIPVKRNTPATPIIAEGDYLEKKDESIVVSINRENNFVLKDIPLSTPLSLGKVHLSKDGNNTIAFFNDKKDNPIIPDFSKIRFSLNPCDPSKGQNLFGITTNKNGFSLYGENTALCMMIPLKEIVQNKEDGNLLLNTYFEYKNDLARRLNTSLCIARLDSGGCVNYVSNNISAKQLFQTSSYYGISNENIDNLGIKIFLDSDANFEQQVIYGNFYFNLEKPFYFVNIPENIIEESISALENESINVDEITIPFSGNQLLSSDITKLPKTNGQCPNNPYSDSTVGGKQIIEGKDNPYIRYSTEKGSLCDHFSYQNLSQDSAYLIVLNSRNIAGLPLSLCVTNYASKRCDIYANLSHFSDFENDIFLLPPMKGENKDSSSKEGFDININSLGIKGTPSVNDLRSIEIIPIPYSWMSQIKNFNKDIKLKDNVLTFSYSFDPGWKAYEVQNSNFLSLYLPFFFGKELKNHVLVNNWENGWLLENSHLSSVNSRLVIVFWPQYLEYLGFIILFGTFGYLTFSYARTRLKT